MKFLDRFEQLVIENARLKEESDHLKDVIAEECAHSSQLREEINSLKDEVHDLKCNLQARSLDLEHQQSSTNYYRRQYKAGIETTRALNDNINDLNARLINSCGGAIADQLLENDVFNEKGEFDFKIERIKQFREKLHCGFKEAKDAIEAAVKRKIAKPKTLSEEVEAEIQRKLATPATPDD